MSRHVDGSKTTEPEETFDKHTISVVGLGGSLAPASTSLTALRVALDAAEEAGADVELLDLRQLHLPVFRPDQHDPPDGVTQMLEKIHKAHGLLWSSPLYNGTISGSFKNAIDWLHLLGTYTPPYLTDKIVGLISTAGGVHALQAINTMEFITRSLRAWAVPLVMPIARASQVFDNEGKVRDRLVSEQLRHLGREVVRAARQMTTRGTCDYSVVGAAPGEVSNA